MRSSRRRRWVDGAPGPDGSKLRLGKRSVHVWNPHYRPKVRLRACRRPGDKSIPGVSAALAARRSNARSPRHLESCESVSGEPSIHSSTSLKVKSHFERRPETCAVHVANTNAAAKTTSIKSRHSMHANVHHLSREDEALRTT